MRRLAPLLLACAFALAACGQPHARTSPSVLGPRAADGPVVVSEEPWEFADSAGRLVRTRNYRIFTTDHDEQIQRHLPEFLETCLDRYTYELAPLPRPSLKLDTFLVADREQWARLTSQLMGEHAATYLRIQRGGFASGGRAILWSIGVRDTFAIAAHEGWHQYTQRAFKGELPVWLEEGIGVYMEGFTFDDAGKPNPAPWANLERFDQLRRASADGRLIPLISLVRATPQELITTGGPDAALNWYAQVWALALFLTDGRDGFYRSALRSLLTDAAADAAGAAVAVRLGRKLQPGPQGSADIFSAYFGPPHALEAEYRAFIDTLVAADRAAISRGGSPLK
jgi:hypothetical protein